eukprot:gene7225-7438_t
MSTGKLKAQYNRVRTSTALHTTSIWSNTIGLQQEQAGTNSVIESQIYAPGGGGGGGRAAKRQRAQELIEATGYQPSVRDFEGLKALARRQGGDAATNRGACKICGGLGHLTKQCSGSSDSGSRKRKQKKSSRDKDRSSKKQKKEKSKRHRKEKQKKSKSNRRDRDSRPKSRSRDRSGQPRSRSRSRSPARRS